VRHRRDGPDDLVAGPLLLSVPDLQPLPISPLQSSGNVALSRDGTMVAQGGSVWDIASGRLLRSPVISTLTWVGFSPDGTIYAESDWQNTLHLYSTADWSAAGAPSIGYRVSGNDIADGRFFFSGDGSRVIASLPTIYPQGEDLPVFHILASQGLGLETLVAEPLMAPRGTAAFSPDGTLVAADRQQTTGLWHTEDLSLLSSIAATSGAYGFLGNGLLSLLAIRIYNPATGQLVAFQPSSWLGVSPDGTLAVTTRTPVPEVTRLADMTRQATLTPDSPMPTVLGGGAAFSRDNRIVVVGVNAGNDVRQLGVFDASTGTMLLTVVASLPAAISTTANGMGRLVAAVPNSTALRVWSIPDGAPLFDIPDVSGNYTYPFDISPDGSLIAAGGDSIRIFHADTGALRETLAAHFDPLSDGPFNPSGVTSLAFSPTGEIVSMGLDSTMRFWCSP